MLTPDEEQELNRLKEEQQARAEEFRRNYTPSEDEIKDAEKATGLSDSGALYRFNAGVVGSLANLAAAPKRVATEVGATVGLPGFEEKAQQNRQEVDLERKLMSHSGTAGTVGNVIGELATGFVPGLGIANRLSKLGNVTRAAVAGAAGGAIGGALQPLGTGDSGLLNTTIGATAGGVLGGAGAAAAAAVGKLRGTLSKNAAVQSYFDKALGDMPEENIQSLNSTIKSLTSGAATKPRYNPTEALRLATNTSKPVSNYVDKVRRLSQDDQINELDVLNDLSRTFPMDKILTKASQGDIIKMHEDIVKQHAQEATKPIYDRLSNQLAPGRLNKEVQKNTALNKVVSELRYSPDISPQDQSALDLLISKKLTADGGNNLPTMQTYNEVNQYINREVDALTKAKARGNNFDQSRLNLFNQAKTSLMNHVRDNQDFMQATQQYQEAMAPLNKLRNSEAYRIFTKVKGNSPYTLNQKAASNYSFSSNLDAKQLGSDLNEFNPNLYRNITASKINNSLNQFSSGAVDSKEMVKSLARIEDFAHESMDQKLLVNMLKNTIKQADTPGAIPVISKLTNERNKQALVDVIANPDRYRMAIRNAFVTNNKQQNLLNLINIISGGSSAIANTPDTGLPAATVGGALAGVKGAIDKAGRLFGERE